MSERRGRVRELALPKRRHLRGRGEPVYLPLPARLRRQEVRGGYRRMWFESLPARWHVQRPSEWLQLQVPARLRRHQLRDQHRRLRQQPLPERRILHRSC